MNTRATDYKQNNIADIVGTRYRQYRYDVSEVKNIDIVSI